MYLRQNWFDLLGNRDIHTRLHDAPVFKVDVPQKESFKRSVHYAGVTIWNSLPVNERNLNNYFAFKMRQKLKFKVKRIRVLHCISLKLLQEDPYHASQLFFL